MNYDASNINLTTTSNGTTGTQFTGANNVSPSTTRQQSTLPDKDHARTEQDNTVMLSDRNITMAIAIDSNLRKRPSDSELSSDNGFLSLATPEENSDSSLLTQALDSLWEQLNNPSTLRIPTNRENQSDQWYTYSESQPESDPSNNEFDDISDLKSLESSSSQFCFQHTMAEIESQLKATSIFEQNLRDDKNEDADDDMSDEDKKSEQNPKRKKLTHKKQSAKQQPNPLSARPLENCDNLSFAPFLNSEYKINYRKKEPANRKKSLTMDRLLEIGKEIVQEYKTHLQQGERKDTFRSKLDHIMNSNVINSLHKNRTCMMHIAVENNSLELLDILHQCQIEPKIGQFVFKYSHNKKRLIEGCPIHRACAQGKSDIVHWFLNKIDCSIMALANETPLSESGLDFSNITNFNFMSMLPIHIASMAGHTNCLQKIILYAKTSDIRKPDSQTSTSQKDSNESLKDFIINRAIEFSDNPHAFNFSNFEDLSKSKRENYNKYNPPATPLTLACQFSDSLATVSMLLNNGAVIPHNVQELLAIAYTGLNLEIIHFISSMENIQPVVDLNKILFNLNESLSYHGGMRTRTHFKLHPQPLSAFTTPTRVDKQELERSLEYHKEKIETIKKLLVFLSKNHDPNIEQHFTNIQWEIKSIQASMHSIQRSLTKEEVTNITNRLESGVSLSDDNEPSAEWVYYSYWKAAEDSCKAEEASYQAAEAKFQVS